jgi:hypothetical protein
MRKQLFWLIQGHDGTKCFFAKTVAIGQFTEDQVRDLLRAMTAKTSLSYPEMMEAYASRRTKAYAARLDVHKDPTCQMYMCGSNPHFTASIVDVAGKLIVNPTV